VRYAVNLADLDHKAYEFSAPILLGPVCPSQLTVEVEKGRVDGVALVLECDDERAKAICDVLAIGAQRKGVMAPRCYQSLTGQGGWRKYKPEVGSD